MGDAPTVTGASRPVKIPDGQPASKSGAVQAAPAKKPGPGLIEMNLTIINDVNRLNDKIHEHEQAEIRAENNGAMWHAMMDPVNDALYAIDVNVEFERLVQDIDDALTGRIGQSPDLTVEAAAAALKNDLKGRVIAYGFDDDVRPDTLDTLIDQAAGEMKDATDRMRDVADTIRHAARDERYKPLRQELVGIRDRKFFKGNLKSGENLNLEDLKKFKQFVAHVKAEIVARPGIDSEDRLVSVEKNLGAEILGDDHIQKDRENVDLAVKWAVDDLKNEGSIVRDMTPAAKKTILDRMSLAERLVAQAIKRSDQETERNKKSARLQFNNDINLIFVEGGADVKEKIRSKNLKFYTSVEHDSKIIPFAQLQTFDKYYYPSYDLGLSKTVRTSHACLRMIDEAVACLGNDYKHLYTKKDELKDLLLQMAKDLTEPDLQEDFKKAVAEYIESLPEYLEAEYLEAEQIGSLR